ncbi:MAG: hypothetical protein EVB11_12950 [Winogradskyella sp.]|nr:MAG: hypothetical protein EVB11_12950 [Winogradskyella sp.]
MKKTIVIAILIFSSNLYAQDTFNDGFCDAVKVLTKKVKKGKIKRAKFDEVTQRMVGYFGVSGQMVNTNQEFMEDYPLFQSDFGIPMSGKSRLVNSFKVLINISSINVNNVEAQKEVSDYLNNLKNAIKDCNCKVTNSNIIPNKIASNTYSIEEFNCGKNGKISVVVDTSELNKDATLFVCYLDFNYIALY